MRDITLNNVFSSLNVDCGHYFRSTRSHDLNWSCDGLDRLCHGKISVANQSGEDLGQYGARHLVTATLDSGQIGGGNFFFCNTPVGHHRQISFDLEDAFTWVSHNFKMHISGKYYILDFH